MSKSVSIIVSCFNKTHVSAHMSMLCLDHIRKFTDPPYELIVIDPIPKEPIRDDYKTLGLPQFRIDPPEYGIKTKNDLTWVKLKKDPGYARGMNMGSELAKGDVLVFIQNDVFVREGWLTGLLYYIEKGFEIVYPDQAPRDRKYVVDSYARSWDDADAMKGSRDEGLIMITRQAFDRLGRWNEKLSLLVNADFLEKFHTIPVKWTDTNKVMITHITAGTNLQTLENDPKEYERKMKHDSRIRKKK